MKKKITPAFGWPFRWIFPLLLTAPLLARCGGSGNSGGAASASDPCQTVYAGQCGKTCAVDVDCANGLFCDPGKTCTAQCATGAATCSAGQTCSDRGRCGANLGNASGGTSGGLSLGNGSDDPGSGGGTACVQQTVSSDLIPPAVMVLIDQSGSMRCDLGLQKICSNQSDQIQDGQDDSNSRWNRLEKALFDNTKGVLRTYQKDIRFGMTFYHGTETLDPAMCPTLTVTAIPATVDGFNVTKAAQDYKDGLPERGFRTPTSDSFKKVRTTAFAGIDAKTTKYIILATDGAPTFCNGDSRNLSEASKETVKEVTAARLDGIGTFAITLSTFDTETDHLKEVAKAGNLDNRPNPVPFQATSPEALAAAFDSIVNEVRSCTFYLEGDVKVEDAPRGTVSLDDKTLAYDKDWTFKAPAQVSLAGETCTQYKKQGGKLSILFPCDVKITIH